MTIATTYSHAGAFFGLGLSIPPFYPGGLADGERIEIRYWGLTAAMFNRRIQAVTRI
jgi:hypothetical protein